MIKFSKGFTILELLVMVAIISVLTSIVLINVTLYINKAKDASIKANMASMLTDAFLFYNANTTYTDLCADTTTSFASAYAEAKTRMKPGGTFGCFSSDTEWASYVQINNPSQVNLSGSSDAWWCIDYTGVKEEITSEPKEPLICPPLEK